MILVVAAFVMNFPVISTLVTSLKSEGEIASYPGLWIEAPTLGLVVKGDRDWFRVEGRAAVDEHAMLDFETVLAIARSRSRFVPMGEGTYVALAHALKTKLADLAAVAETDRDGMRVSRVAALWLDEALEGAIIETDDAFRQSLEKLRRAQDDEAGLPKSLQAEFDKIPAKG